LLRVRTKKITTNDADEKEISVFFNFVILPFYSLMQPPGVARENLVKLLGVTFNNHLSFADHACKL